MARQVELLSPAGSLAHARAAFGYGADAVYAGLARYSLRVRNNQFDLSSLQQGIALAHQLNKKFFIALNLIAHNTKVKSFLKDIEPIIKLNPDALIMADAGLIMMVKEKYPSIPIHLSVQANTTNYAGVKFWQKIGVSRIILSRELSLEEIEEIKQQCPEMELEVFVHGALCIAYSGRCLLSGYFNQRDPNQGTCTNACRWSYDIVEGEEKITGEVVAREQNPARQKAWLMQMNHQANQSMPIEEDELGTYILNSKDLRAAEHIHQLVKIGVDSLKIEGRTKSVYYAARTAQIYSQIIKDALQNQPFKQKYLLDLENLSSRGYTDGFYKRHHSSDYQNYLQGSSKGFRQEVVGEVVDYQKESRLLKVEVKNFFDLHSKLELMKVSGNLSFSAQSLLDEDGYEIAQAQGNGYTVFIQCDQKTNQSIKTAIFEQMQQNIPVFLMRYLEDKPSLSIQTKSHQSLSLSKKKKTRGVLTS